MILRDDAEAAQAEVWIVEHGDDEQRGVWVVHESLDAAVALLKAQFAPPYIVRWEDVRDTSSGERREWTLTGHFEAVQHYSTRHQGDFTITPYLVRKADR